MNRTKQIIIRLSPNEYTSIQGKARALGLSVASFMRFIAIEARFEIEMLQISKTTLKNIKKRFGR